MPLWEQGEGRVLPGNPLSPPSRLQATGRWRTIDDCSPSLFLPWEVPVALPVKGELRGCSGSLRLHGDTPLVLLGHFYVQSLHHSIDLWPLPSSRSESWIDLCCGTCGGICGNQQVWENGSHVAGGNEPTLDWQGKESGKWFRTRYMWNSCVAQELRPSSLCLPSVMQGRLVVNSNMEPWKEQVLENVGHNILPMLTTHSRRASPILHFSVL